MKTKLIGSFIICVMFFLSMQAFTLANSLKEATYESKIRFSLYSTIVQPNVELIADEIEEDAVKPWEGFRGWSPRVPYGQSSKQSENKTDENKETITNEDDDVKPWEGFRGWSPRVPY
jgi:hypothetical protein